jgi:hypothetical protein
MTSSKPILYTQGNINFIKIAQHLQDDYRFIIGDPKIVGIVRDMGIEVASLEDAIDEEMLIRAKSEGLWYSLSIMNALSYPLRSLDKNVAALSHPQLQRWFPPLTYDIISYTLSRIWALERIIEEHGIAGILLHEDVTVDGRLLAAVGRAQNVPIMHVPHANHFIDPRAGDIHADSRADYIGVYGQHMFDWYAAAGVAPEKLTIIGGAHWEDVYKEAESLSMDHARRCFGLPLNKLVYMYATSWAQGTNTWGRGQEDLYDSMRWVMQAAKDADAHVLAKIHPHEPMQHADRYAEIAKESGVHTVFTSNYLGHCLAAADVVITQGSSNIAVEAGIMGKPVAEMFQPGTQYPQQFNIPGTWGPDLPAMITRAIEEGVNQDFLQAMHAGRGAGDRLREWIKGIVDADIQV